VCKPSGRNRLHRLRILGSTQSREDVTAPLHINIQKLRFYANSHTQRSGRLNGQPVDRLLNDKQEAVAAGAGGCTLSQGRAHVALEKNTYPN